jgi:hypothetical protein
MISQAPMCSAAIVAARRSTAAMTEKFPAAITPTPRSRASRSISA